VKGGRDLRYLNALPRYLLKLPYMVRLSIAAGCVLLFLIVYMVVTPASRNPSILVVPMALCAWMFKRRGVFISLGTMLVVLWIYYAIHDETLVLSGPMIIAFVLGCGSLLIEGVLISWQRDALDLADEAQRKIATVYEQQQQLNQTRDQFILNVNHELRTPLTAVYGYLELLLTHNEFLDAETQATFLKNAMYSCEELQLLVNNVLDTIQVGTEKDQIPLEELSVLEVVQEVVGHADPRWLQEHNIRLEVPDYLVVRANAQYLRQVLRNLLSNAFKYAPVETPLLIKAELYGQVVQSSHPSPQICISVKDSGPGIPPEEIPRLFAQFVRLRRDVTGKVRGTGLGLYVSKQLIEAMGGTIWVESSGIPGEGSRFCFTLPCVPRPKIIPKTKNTSQSQISPIST
jgi:signal transduction histidine kinase